MHQYQHDPVFWYAQSVGMVIVCILMVIVLIRSVHWSLTHKDDPGSEHGPVVAAVALVVGIGNIVTTYATAIRDEWLRDTGGEVIRAAIVVGVLYMLAWGPWKGRRRP